MGKQYRSKVFAAAHEMAEGMFTAGIISAAEMREYDAACLVRLRRFTPEQIQQLRQREEVSQAVFARYLGLSTGLISQWERGEKHPRGASLKLLSLVEKKGLDAVA